MLNYDLKLYSLNDITIIPATTTTTRHRAEGDVYYDDTMLPIFTAPMSCVIDENNWEMFENEGINTIIPRSVNLETRLRLMFKTWIAVGLDEFKENFIDNDPLKATHTAYICIDIANGHMQYMIDLVKEAKEKHGELLQLMVGNIANPYTYEDLAKADVDYIRFGIGSGNVCTTSANSGVHYPMASLLDSTKIFRDFLISTKQITNVPKIIADGGFKNFDQINKALALGADYVMLGEIFAKSEEACGKTFEYNGLLSREYYGMSTRRAQKEFGKDGTKTAEGILKCVPIEYPLSRWVDNFKHWLREAMSLTDCKNLEEFKTCVDLGIMSPQGYSSYWK